MGYIFIRIIYIMLNIRFEDHLTNIYNSYYSQLREKNGKR